MLLVGCFWLLLATACLLVVLIGCWCLAVVVVVMIVAVVIVVVVVVVCLFVCLFVCFWLLLLFALGCLFLIAVVNGENSSC